MGFIPTQMNPDYILTHRVFKIHFNIILPSRTLSSKISSLQVGYEVLTAASMKMAVFWVVAPCSLVEVMMEAARTSETLVYFYQTTRHYNPEDCHLRFPSSFSTKILFAFLISSMRVTCPAHLIFLDLIVLIIYSDELNHEAP
jgi:hypothetical protein